MITRPDPAAGAEENTALERLARLRAAAAGPQPVTAAEVRAAIRRWIGDSLPEYVRALASPAKMRAWIGRQATDRAGRPGTGSYDRRPADAITAHPPKDCGPAKAATTAPRPSSCGRKSPHGYSRA